MPVPNEKEAYEFTMEFISISEQYKNQYVDRWREVLANYLVEPVQESVGTSKTPYTHGRIYTSRKRQVILKDPETHKAVMTYAAKLVRSLLGSREREYIKARPRGYEDAPNKAPTVSRYLKYCMALPGTFRTFVEAIVDMLIFGTAVVEVNWEYEEREQPVRFVTQEQGLEYDEEMRLRIPVYDDVRITPIDIVDFFPDPSRYRIQDMSGAAKRFKVTAIEARAKAKSEIWDKQAVNQAINNIGKQGSDNLRKLDDFREDLDQPTNVASHSDFREMIAYEYWGDVPWNDDQGSSRRVITVLNNVVVRNDPWPLADSALPWHTLIITPTQGRFYGISPAEIIRHDQDFADALKVLLAEAMIRQVHPPIAFDPDSDPDIAALRAWKPDALVGIRGGPSSVGALRYDANVANGFGMLSALKASMQEASGALGGIQGEPGPNRESATGAATRMQFAMDRPELAAMVLENECLPPIGKACLARGQQFLDTEGLRERIGEMPEPVWIGDIMGDFDVEFVGSRMDLSRQEKLQSVDRLIALASAVPNFAVRVKWDEIYEWLVGDVMQLPEVAGAIDDQEMLRNLMMQQLLGAGGSHGNGQPVSAEPAGALPAQMSGEQP